MCILGCQNGAFWAKINQFWPKKLTNFGPKLTNFEPNLDQNLVKPCVGPVCVPVCGTRAYMPTGSLWWVRVFGTVHGQGYTVPVHGTPHLGTLHRGVPRWGVPPTGATWHLSRGIWPNLAKFGQSTTLIWPNLPIWDPPVIWPKAK